MREFFLLLVLFFNFSVFAARSVSISVPDGKLQLTNGSAVAVTYSVECYDKTTGSNVISSGSNQVLEPKKDISYASSSSCTNGSTLQGTMSEGPFYCSKSVNYVNAPSLCPSGAHLCTIKNLKDRGITSLFAYGYYWISPGTSTDWSQYSGESSNYSTNSGKKFYAPVTYSKKGSGTCYSGLNATGDSVPNCTISMTSNSNSGALCCPDNNGFSSCKVTVESATAAGGHLQSPQFKGGASF